MQVDNKKETSIFIDTEVIIATAMYVNKKLDVSFKDINKVKDFFYKKLKDTNTNGSIEWCKEGLGRIKREDKSFFVGKNNVYCVDGWERVNGILSNCDKTILDFIFEQEKIVKSKQYSKEKI